MCVCPTNLQLQVLRLSAVIFAKNFVSEVKTLKFNREHPSASTTSKTALPNTEKNASNQSISLNN
jgi:hypothetical protein